MKIKHYSITNDEDLDNLIDDIDNGKNGKYFALGLRGISKPESGKRNLRNSTLSVDNADGTIGKTRLSGTSVVHVVGDWDYAGREELINGLRKAYDTVKMYDQGYGIAIVKGHLQTDEIFNDAGEAVLSGAEAVGYLDEFKL